MEIGLGSTAAVVLGLTAALGVVRHWRARAARRWFAAMDAYAEREIADHRRRQEASAGQGLENSLSAMSISFGADRHGCSGAGDGGDVERGCFFLEP